MPATSLVCNCCNKIFLRRQLSISENTYCSRSCAAKINNSKYPKHPGIKKKCATCTKLFVSREKYCSAICQYQGLTITKESILTYIHDFYIIHGRIPLKREFNHQRAARERFGSWNKAIEAAGYNPNPVLFAKKYLAKDGHKCDSLAEKIIDDWLFSNEITHLRTVPYPEIPELTVDFVVGDYHIEFFGLYGVHKRYDELRKIKLRLVKKYKLHFIAIYPHHLFPENKLQDLLKF